MLFEYQLNTHSEDFHDITSLVRKSIQKSGITEGQCLIFCPHTTAGITINENADPDVVGDMLLGFSKAYPDRAEFRHFEGNSAAHLKASAVGSSVSLILAGGQPLLGRWQGIYFCEFDGPRSRTFFVQIN